MSDPYKPYFSKIWNFDSDEGILDFFLNDSFFKSGDVFGAGRVGKGGMIYRGHSNAAWGLVPKAFRPENHLKGFTPQPPVDFYSESQRFDPYHLHRQLGMHLHAETRSVLLFLEYADNVGLSTPFDPTAARERSQVLKAAFDEDFEYEFKEPFPEPKFERAFALAQHYGVPTRFLDWTESPLVALYFAAIEALGRSSKNDLNQPPSEQEQNYIHEGNLAVVFTGSSKLRDVDSECSLITVPRHENVNLRAQMGVFTYIRSANRKLIENNWWPTLTDDGFRNFQIYCATLAVDKAIPLLQQLHDLNVTTLTMQPSLVNAAQAHKYVERLYRKRN